MDIDQENYNPGEIHLLPATAHQPLPSSIRSFGGVRHGFNNRSNRAFPYPPMSNTTPHPNRLAPMQSVIIDPAPNIRVQNLLVQQLNTPSQISSEHFGSMNPNSMERGPVCIDCGHHTGYTLPNQRPVPDVDLAQAAFNAASQSARIDVNDLLNSAPASENQCENRNLFPGLNNASANITEPGKARTISGGSIITISSSNTFHPTSSSSSSRISLIVDLYYTCRDATESYITTLRPVRRHTACSRYHRHHPYFQNSRAEASACEGRTRTLMDNISIICTHMWRRARSDVLAPHREEAGAVRDMRDLYAWGEIISRASQSDDLEEGDVDWESARGSLCSGLGTNVWTKVGEAAKKLCEWLGDAEASDICEGVVNELKELKVLKEKDGGFSDLEDFGGIS